MSKTSGLTITLNNQSAANNTSNITVYGYIKCNSGSFRTNKTLNWYITINGTKITTTGTSSVGTTKASGSLTTSARAGSSSTSYYTNVMVDWTGNVSHDSLGACTVKAHFDFYGDWVSETTTKTLTAIPQAATLTSVTNTTAGGDCTYTFTPKNNSYTYKLTFTGANNTSATIDIAASSSTISRQYTMQPDTWHKAIPNSKTGTITATLKTYSGTTQIGSASSKTFTLTANPNYVPIVTGATYSLNNGYSGYYVQNKSSVTITPSATIQADSLNGEPNGGATIVSYTITIGGMSYTTTSASITSGILSISGNNTVTVTATDTRGNVSEAYIASNAIYVYPYEPPKLTGNVFRSDPSGDAQPTLGTCAKLNLTASCSSVNNTNTIQNTIIKYKADSDSSYTDISSNGLKQTRSGISASNKYIFTVTITDSIGTSKTATYTIPSAFMLLHFNTAGHGMAIGGGNTIDRTVQSYLPMRTKYGITYDNGGGFYDSTNNVEGHKINPARLADANLPSTGITGMNHFLATDSMSTGKPATDGHIINCSWDWTDNLNTPGNYDSQLFIPNAQSGHMAFRAQGGSAWSGNNWKELIDTGGGQLDSLMAVHSVSIDNLTINSDSYLSNQTKSAALTGYTPLCIVGWYIEAASTNGTLNSWVFPYRLEISGSNLIVSLRNTSTSGAAKVKVTADVLYLKN